MPVPPAPTTPDQLEHVSQVAARIVGVLEQVISGRREAIEMTVVALLAEGHLLIEDVPGIGKTTLAKALGAAISCRIGRVQFTPDLLPGDLTGSNVYRSQSQEFTFVPGPIFANIVIADEINRASPKTQAALLECMQESQVTVDGTSYLLARPFLVVATQNPIEMEGTYALPEAQRDRFMIRLAIGYPSADQEQAMLDQQERGDPLSAVGPVTDAATVARTIDLVRALHASDEVKRYAVELVRATRTERSLRLGASPRASIQLMRAAKAHAVLAGRAHVLPDDVQAVALPVLAHRLVPTREARAAGTDTEEVLRGLLQRVPVRR